MALRAPRPSAPCARACGCTDAPADARGDPRPPLERLDLPAQRDADPRHATLRATIQWSYDLLGPAERELFSNLAIFRGGCTLDAAEDVCGAVLETLASLLDKSLLRRRTPDDAVERYWMLETIREFALATLDERGEGAAALRARHAHRMLSIARSAKLEWTSSR